MGNLKDGLGVTTVPQRDSGTLLERAIMLENTVGDIFVRYEHRITAARA